MKAPAFQFYPQDFISSLDVQVMSVEQVGAYILLLSNAWIHDPQGYLPNNETLLQRICRMNDKQWSKNKSLILKKFEKEGEFIFNARLLKELEKQGEYRKKQALNGAKGGRPKANDNPEKAVGYSGLTQTEPKKSSSFSSSTSSSFSSSTSGILLEKESKAPPLLKEENSEGLSAKKEKPKEKSSAKKEKVDFGDFDTPEFRAKWQEFLEHRKKIKAPITTIASEQRIFNQLTAFDIPFAIQLIEATVDSGKWQGLVFKDTYLKFQQYQGKPINQTYNGSANNQHHEQPNTGPSNAVRLAMALAS